MAINLGNGQFRIEKLPVEAQLSSVNAISCLDLNHDGAIDLVLGGNEFGFLPQFGRLDASLGLVLMNNGKGEFTPLDTNFSGLNLKGQVRDIRLIPGKEKSRLLFLQNDEYPVLYDINQRFR